MIRKAYSARMWNTGLEFGVLGPLQVTVGGKPMPLGAPKQRAVLAVLVINRNRPVSIESLIDAVWDRRPVPAARTSIHSYVSRLRQLLGAGGLDSNRVLASAPPGYRLSVADADCDVGRFFAQQAAGVHAAASGRFEHASKHLSAALAEWRGPVLEDLRDFAFVDAFATALLEDKVVAQTALAEAEIACGRADTVIGDLEALTAKYPFRERLWAQLITAYYVAERQSDALDAYRRLKVNLAENLGIDPGPTVSALHQRILRQEPIDAKQSAQTTAQRSAIDIGTRSHATELLAAAGLRDKAGRLHRLQAATTRIGRLSDNDIVLDDEDVSRYHAVIVDTGTGYVISDLRSTNGVTVQHERIQATTSLNHGDHIGICGHDFTFELHP